MRAEASVLAFVPKKANGCRSGTQDDTYRKENKHIWGFV